MRKVFIFINALIITISITVIIFMEDFYKIDREIKKLEIDYTRDDNSINELRDRDNISFLGKLYLTLKYIDLQKLKDLNFELNTTKHYQVFKILEGNITNKIKKEGVDYFLDGNNTIIYNCSDREANSSSKFKFYDYSSGVEDYEFNKSMQLQFYECKVLFSKDKYRLIAIPKSEKLSLAIDIETIKRDYEIGKQ